MSAPMNRASPVFPSVPLRTTKRGRRWGVCPECCAIAARIPMGATQHTCAHCQTVFTLIVAADGGQRAR